MRSVLPALVLAGLVASPAAAQPLLAPGPYVHTPGGTYVQYYDPRTGVPVGGPVAVGPGEFAARAAMVPADAPVIRVRPAPDLDDEPVVRPRRVVRPHLYGPRPLPRPYGARVYAPAPRVGVYAPGPRYREPIYVGPRRYAPAPFRYGRPVRGFEVVPARRAGVHVRHFGPRGPHVMPHRVGPHRFGPPPHHRMGPPPRRVGAAHPLPPRGPAPRPDRRY